MFRERGALQSTARCFVGKREVGKGRTGRKNLPEKSPYKGRKMNDITEKSTVENQYKTAQNLSTRISLHQKYSTNKQGFANWIFEHYEITPNAAVLELGCGTGEMWKAKLSLLPQNVSLTLTDFSAAMVESTKNGLHAVAKNASNDATIAYNIVDIQNIPYAADSFDCVIANMMLYHVGDMARGLAEVGRVLKSDGTFYCATYGENGIVPFVAHLLRDYGIADTTNKNFTLQNGAKILQQHFARVTRFDYEDSLAVTDIDDLLDYIFSLADMVELTKIARGELKSVLQGAMQNGVLRVPKEYGMFVCKN